MPSDGVSAILILYQEPASFRQEWHAIVDETAYPQPADASGTSQHGAVSDLTADMILPPIWKRDLRWILLALAGGIAVGTPFLVFAYTLLGRDNVALLYPWLFFLGGLAIIIGPATLTMFDTWQSSRRIKQREQLTA